MLEPLILAIQMEAQFWDWKDHNPRGTKHDYLRSLDQLARWNATPFSTTAQTPYHHQNRAYD